MHEWKFWDWMAYVALFICAGVLASDTALHLAPNLTPYIPQSAVWGFAPLVLLIFATAILLAKALGWIGRGPAKHSGVARPIPTSLKLQFDYGDVAPHCINEKNIWRWYALAQILRVVGQDGTVTPSKFWLLFLVFNEAVDFKDIRISAGRSKLPLHEVKDSGPRHVFIYFDGNLEGLVLDVFLEPRLPK
jgi:hypothetical protein